MSYMMHIERFNTLIQEIMGMSLSVQMDFFQALEEELTAAGRPIPWAQEPSASSFDPPIPGMDEEREYDIILLEKDNDVLWTIRVVRALSDLNPAQAKALVESAPVVIRRGVDMDTAYDIKEDFREGGVRVIVCESSETEAQLAALRRGELPPEYLDD